MSGGVVFEKEEIQRILVNLCFPVEEIIPVMPRMKKKRVLVIAGPTGCGKTELSLEIAKYLDGEIVSADSMQVYKGMDIGTAKASAEEQKSTTHHLIDIRNVNEQFNVVDFYYEARHVSEKIFARNNVPIVVGGTGFYIRALLYGPPSGPPSIESVRKSVEKEMEQKGAVALYEKVLCIDPDYAATISKNDRQKIIRALEIYTLTGEKISDLSWKERTEPLNYDFVCWFIHRSRETLYKRIEDRCDEMLSAGLLDEVRNLEECGLRHNSSASNAIGYRHCLEYFATEQTQQDYDAFVNKFKTASRHYAKRQFTWFKKQPHFRWLNIEDHDFETACDIIINDFLARI